jgi:catalase
LRVNGTRVYVISRPEVDLGLQESVGLVWHWSEQLPSDSTASAGKQPAALSRGSALRRLVGIGVIILCVAGGFLYLGGWFSPNALTPARFVDAFERTDGVHSGFRRNHAKGVGVSGYFESNGEGARLSKALVFRPGRVPVIGRFSFGGGDPNVADAPNMVRGLGLLFRLPDGEEWRTAMVNLPVFPFQTPQAFYDNLVASQPDPKTGKPDPEKMAAFGASHPATVRALGIIQSHAPSSGFDNTAFNSLNAFRFIDGAGTSIPVRWTLAPVQPFAAASAAPTAQTDKNSMFDALIASILQHPLQWHLTITIGQSGDPTNDATVAWPDGREQVDVGTLTLDHVESEETSPARDINFDPLVLPSGMAPSDDPLLSARSAIYSQSFTRRAVEAKTPSAISPAEVRK